MKKLEEACSEIDQCLGVESGMAVRYVRGKLNMTYRWDKGRDPRTIIDDWCWSKGGREGEVILRRNAVGPNTVRFFIRKSTVRILDKKGREDMEDSGIILSLNSASDGFPDLIREFGAETAILSVERI